MKKSEEIREKYHQAYQDYCVTVQRALDKWQKARLELEGEYQKALREEKLEDESKGEVGVYATL